MELCRWSSVTDPDPLQEVPMIGALIQLIIVLLIAGVFWYLISALLPLVPLPAPFAQIINVLLVLHHGADRHLLRAYPAAARAGIGRKDAVLAQALSLSALQCVHGDVGQGLDRGPEYRRLVLIEHERAERLAVSRWSH